MLFPFLSLIVCAIDLNENFLELPSSNRLLMDRFLMHFITFSKLKPVPYLSSNDPVISRSLVISSSSSS